MNYYNENDPKAAQWLRNLVAGGMIPAGDVDDRSIKDVRPIDLNSLALYPHRLVKRRIA